MENEKTVKFAKKAPRIKFGEEYKAWPDAKKIDYLEKLSSSLNYALEVMQGERDFAYNAASAMEQRMDAAIRMKDTQAKITQEQLLQSNAQNQRNLQKIQQLSATVRARDAVIEKLNGGNG